MSYENDNMNDDSDTNLGKHGSPPSTTQRMEHKQPINMVYTQQQTVLKMPKLEFPKFRYDHGFPDYPKYSNTTTYIYDYPSPYKVRDDNISKFFIGSITVVGLFILFRVLEKNK